jgi:hypothetical protein
MSNEDKFMIRGVICGKFMCDAELLTYVDDGLLIDQITTSNWKRGNTVVDVVDVEALIEFYWEHITETVYNSLESAGYDY